MFLSESPWRRCEIFIAERKPAAKVRGVSINKEQLIKRSQIQPLENGNKLYCRRVQ